MSTPQQASDFTLAPAPSQSLQVPAIHINLPANLSQAANVPNPAVSAAPPTDDSTARRIADLMSQKDRAANEAERLRAELQLAQAQAAAQAQDYTAKLAAAEHAQAALNAAKAQAEAQAQVQTAETLKLQALAQKPHLLKYAAFIQPSLDAAKLAESIAVLDQMVSADIASATAALTPPPAPPGALTAPRPVYPPAAAPVYGQTTALPAGTAPPPQPLAQADFGSRKAALIAEAATLKPQVHDASDPRWLDYLRRAEALAREEAGR